MRFSTGTETFNSAGEKSWFIDSFQCREVKRWKTVKQKILAEEDF